jgi:enoyl-CoA hydratase/carnithine racemase
MMLDFLVCIERLSTLPGVPVVVHSTAQNAFCAGGDLKSVRAHLMDSDTARAMLEVMSFALDALAAHPGVVIAAVEGPALGGGAELLTACDILILGERARIGFVHAALGVSPGWGGSGRLIRKVGRRAALRWLADPRPRPADACVAELLADTVVPAGSAVEAARSQAQVFANAPIAARIAAAKLVKDPHADASETFLSLWGGPDHLRSLAAVKAGR